ncbi:MAG: HAD family hydrolase [Treponema sp.]|nr:HAD family hydrolase [Treponema sp.]
MKITGKTVLLFDLDGTLTDPAEGIKNSFIHALKFFGLEIPSYETLCSFIGPPLIDTFKNTFGFDEEKARLGVKKYREYFGTVGLFENAVYAGIPKLLEDLKSAGYRLLIATSKPEEFSVRIAEKFDFAKYFEKICGSNLDETRSRKAEVIKYALECAGISDDEKSKVLMIGDRHHDIDGAKEIGIESCGILFGYGDRKEHEEAGANYIAETVEDLSKLLL